MSTVNLGMPTRRSTAPLPQNWPPGPLGLPIAVGETRLTSIDLYLTRRCQRHRKCIHCFLADSYFGNEDMSLDMIKGILRWSVREVGDPEPLVDSFTLLGGEPFLHPEFAEIVRLIHATGREVRVVTNGEPKARQVLDKNKGIWPMIDCVALSLDGPDAASHNAIRGEGSYEQVMLTREYLYDRGIPFRINWTATRATADRYQEMFELARRLGAVDLNIHTLTLSGRARLHAADQELDETTWSKIWRAAHRANNREIARYTDQLNLRPGEQPDPPFQIECEVTFATPPVGPHNDLFVDYDMCGVRDVSTLQVFPDGAAMSCPLYAEKPELGGYGFIGGATGSLYRRGDPGDEIARVASDTTDCAGCPLKTPVNGQRPPCILARAESRRTREVLGANQ